MHTNTRKLHKPIDMLLHKQTKDILPSWTSTTQSIFRSFCRICFKPEIHKTF